MQEDKTKKGFFNTIKEKLSTKTNSAFDQMDSRDKIKERYKQTRNKKIAYFLVACVIAFIVLIILRAITLYNDSQIEHAKKEERQQVDIKVDNFALWQQQTEQKMQNLDKSTKQGFEEIHQSIQGIKQDGLKGLESAIAKGFSQLSSKLKSIDERVENINSATSKKIADMDDRITKQNTFLENIKNEIFSLVGKNKDEFNQKLQDLQTAQNDLAVKTEQDKAQLLAEQEKRLQEGIDKGEKGDKSDKPKKVTGEDIVGFPSEGEEGGEETEELQASSEPMVTKKLKINVTQKEPDPDEEFPDPNQPRDLSFDIMLGMSRAILVNGADASILGMGRQEDAPVAFSILSKMSIANGEYTNTKDCLALGSAVGHMTVQKAQIRLDKISCIFTNTEGDKFIAEGPVQGWVVDENGQLGVQGVLITQEGKILRSTLPLAAVQTALDYITRSATNVVIPTGGTTSGLSNVNASFGMGTSNAANQSLNRIIQIYEKYLQALNPVVNIRAGREVTLLFKGGEKITLMPYKGQGIAGIDTGDDVGMGDEKYNYQEDKNAFMEDY